MIHDVGYPFFYSQPFNIVLILSPWSCGYLVPIYCRCRIISSNLYTASIRLLGSNFQYMLRRNSPKDLIVNSTHKIGSRDHFFHIFSALLAGSCQDSGLVLLCRFCHSAAPLMGGSKCFCYRKAPLISAVICGQL